MLLSFVIEDEKIYPKYLNLIQIKFGNIYQLEILLMMITRKILAHRPIDHNKDEIRPNQPIITEKIDAQTSQLSFSTGFQSQTQTTPVNFNPKMNNTETTESLPHFEVIKCSAPTSSAPMTDNNIPMQVRTRVIRSNPDSENDPNKC